MNDFEDQTTKCLIDGEINKKYIVKDIITGEDEEMKNFLFSLGCYEGQPITIISRLNNNFVVVIKDARYSIDMDLAQAILI